MDSFRFRDRSGITDFGSLMLGCFCGFVLIALLGGGEVVGKKVLGRYWAMITPSPDCVNCLEAANVQVDQHAAKD